VPLSRRSALAKLQSKLSRLTAAAVGGSLKRFVSRSCSDCRSQQQTRQETATFEDRWAPRRLSLRLKRAAQADRDLVFDNRLNVPVVRAAPACASARETLEALGFKSE